MKSHFIGESIFLTKNNGQLSIAKFVSIEKVIIGAIVLFAFLVWIKSLLFFSLLFAAILIDFSFSKRILIDTKLSVLVIQHFFLNFEIKKETIQTFLFPVQLSIERVTELDSSVVNMRHMLLSTETGGKKIQLLVFDKVKTGNKMKSKLEELFEYSILKIERIDSANNR